MSEILQGTTPTIKAKIPESLSVVDINMAELTIMNGGVKLIKHMSDLVIDYEENALRYTFTEEETMELNGNSSLLIQFRFGLFGGRIVGTRQYRYSVYDLISEERMQ